MGIGQSSSKAAEMILPAEMGCIETFPQALSRHGLRLERENAVTLQVNVGLLCNQTCKHCHLDAGPHRREIMDRETVQEVLAYAERNPFEVIDITGGAPELNPHIFELVDGCTSLASRIMFRSNLSALLSHRGQELRKRLQEGGITIVASFPALNMNQTDAQRGDGIFQKSVDAFQQLNALGYGEPDTGLELNLVSNPTGAFLAPSQKQAEERFRQVLKNKWDIHFNHLFNFANVPLGRFRKWLIKSGNMEAYMKKLSTSFNPCAVAGLMCRSLVSVSWDGYLYDCDFNIAAQLGLGGKRIHVSEMDNAPSQGSPIATADHCYTCTAGSGFT